MNGINSGDCNSLASAGDVEPTSARPLAATNRPVALAATRRNMKNSPHGPHQVIVPVTRRRRESPAFKQIRQAPHRRGHPALRRRPPSAHRRRPTSRPASRSLGEQNGPGGHCGPSLTSSAVDPGREPQTTRGVGRAASLRRRTPIRSRRAVPGAQRLDQSARLQGLTPRFSDRGVCSHGSTRRRARFRTRRRDRVRSARAHFLAVLHVDILGHAASARLPIKRLARGAITLPRDRDDTQADTPPFRSALAGYAAAPSPARRARRQDWAFCCVDRDGMRLPLPRRPGRHAGGMHCRGRYARSSGFMGRHQMLAAMALLATSVPDRLVG